MTELILILLYVICGSATVKGSRDSVQSIHDSLDESTHADLKLELKQAYGSWRVTVGLFIFWPAAVIYHIMRLGDS